MLEFCSAVWREKATLLRRKVTILREKATNRMRFSRQTQSSFRRDAKSPFSRLTKDGQFRIAPKAPSRPGSSRFIRIIGIRSKPFRMIFLYIYKNKPFAMISLRKNRGGAGGYLTQNFKSGPGLRQLAWRRHSCLCSLAVDSRTRAKSRRMRTYEFAELKAPLE